MARRKSTRKNDRTTNRTSQHPTDLLEAATSLPEGATGPIHEEGNIAAQAKLHANMLAQLNAAFERHHWLATASGVGALLDRHCRSSNRGRKKDGLDGALYYALQLTAVFATGQATIEQMYVVARSLPMDTRLKYGLVRISEDGTQRELTRRQLDTMTSGLKRNLSYTDCLTDTERLELTQEQQDALTLERRADRHQVVNEIVTRLLKTTHIIDTNHGTYAIDDTAIWAWSKGSKERYVHGGLDRPLTDEDSPQAPDATAHSAAPCTPTTPTEATETTKATEQAADESERTRKEKQDPSPWLCPDADWGGKTAKNGQQTPVYGYKAHVIVNTNDPAGQRDLPVLIQALELTPASADIVDVSLRLIDQIRDHSPFDRLIGDRHYGYKKLDRWAMQLWQRRIHQVLDLRADKPGPIDQYGSKVIDGRPHCPGLAPHLENLTLPDDPTDRAQFAQQIEHRQKFALRMVKGPLASPTKTANNGHDPKVGITRWQCPASAGQVGCPLRPGTVAVARDLGLPTVPNPPADDPANTLPKCCTQATIQIHPDKSMKYLQDEYWGSREWASLYALRSAVEAVFGNIKNRGTEDVRRGFTQVTGLPLVTLAVAAAAACYNIRITEKHARESGQRLEHPLLNHPYEGQRIESVLLHDDQVTEYIARYHQRAA